MGFLKHLKGSLYNTIRRAALATKATIQNNRRESHVVSSMRPGEKKGKKEYYIKRFFFSGLGKR